MSSPLERVKRYVAEYEDAPNWGGPTMYPDPPKLADLKALLARLEHLERALDLARNRLRAAAINEAHKQSREYYDYSQWADEADRALTQSGNQSNDQSIR